MNIKTVAIAGAIAFAALPAFAEGHASGDAAAGEEAFGQCVSCHVVVSPEGETLAGRNAKTGPNLYGVMGRQAGSAEDFRYGDGIIAAGAGGDGFEGLMWDEASFVAYVQDPTGFLREYTNDRRARGKMSYRVRSEDDAKNLWAYLSQFGAENM
jgi:cytochrome c